MIWFLEYIATPHGALLALSMTILGAGALVGLGAVRAATRSRRQNRSALATTFKAVPLGIALYDAAHRLVIWNEAFSALMTSLGVEPRVGMARVAVIGQSTAGALRLAPDLGGFTDFGDAGRDWEGRIPDGRWLKIERRPLPDGGLVAVFSDITDARRLTEAMQEARDRAEAASRAKSDFLATISHEIRTPLNGVLGMIQAVERGDLSAEQRDRVAVAQDSALRLRDALTDIVDLAEIESGRATCEAVAFDVGALGQDLRDALAPAAAAKGLSLALEVEWAARGWRLGDVVKLRRVLCEFLSNAIRFTEVGGVRLEIAGADDGLVFRVHDTGIGIEPADAARLFESFVQGDASATRRHGGLGVGLALCREFAALLGGAVTVEGAPGRGACFALTVPLPPVAAPAATAAPAAAAPSALNILVAEDNPVNQLVIRSLLEPLAACVTVAADGRAAVEAYTDGAFALILMDIQMPVLSGVDAARAIRDLERREGRPRTPILAVTANVAPSQIESYRDAGIDGCVAKPIDLPTLYAAIDSVLADSATAEAA